MLKNFDKLYKTITEEINHDINQIQEGDSKMIKASEAQKASLASNDNFKNTREFKYAIGEIERGIKKAISGGSNELRGPMRYLVEKSGGYPSDKLINAIKRELQENGYSFEERHVMTPNGFYNTCFTISW